MSLLIKMPLKNSHFYSLPYLPIAEAEIENKVKNTDLVNDKVWIGIAEQTHQANIINKKKQSYAKQSQAVRLLLEGLLHHLQIQDSLIETNYPYYLKNSGHFICFSHSSNKCALILCRHNAGIDIELRDVKWKIAERYFHKNELALLQKLGTKSRQLENRKVEEEQLDNSLLAKQWLCNQLWKIKECFIKINQNTLASGMGMDLSFLIEDLVEEFVKKRDSLDKKNNLNNVYTLGNISVDLTKYDSNKICPKGISQVFIDNINDVVVVY